MGSSWLLITTLRLGSCTIDFEYQTQTLSDKDECMIYVQPLKIITHLASQMYVLPGMVENDRTAGDNEFRQAANTFANTW